MGIDFPTVASVFYVAVMTMSSNSLMTRKVMSVVIGNILLMRARGLQKAGKVSEARTYFRSAYIVFVTGLSYNWFYDSIGLAGFILGILGMQGYSTLIGLYQALALTNAEGWFIPARIFMAVSHATAIEHYAPPSSPDAN